jgi:heptosyltransferase-2
VRILIIRACAIGDFVLNLPALRALSLAHPVAQFTLVGYPETLSLARPFIPIDAIYSIETQPWSSLFTGPFPGGLPFDAAFVWMKDPTVAANLRHSGIPLVSQAPAFPPPGVHAASHLLQTVGLPAPELPDLWYPAATQIILHPGSGSPAKVWPRFKELAQSLPDAVPLPTTLSLPEVAEHLRNCRVFIGNDSGITHIAAYWGIPTVALFGPTDSKIWGPVGRRVNILQKPSLVDISKDDVRNLL